LTNPTAMTPNIATRIRDVMVQAMMNLAFEAGMVAPARCAAIADQAASS
jgi:hypothetical protein